MTVGFQTLTVMRSSSGDVMPVVLASIDWRIGDALLSTTINIERTSDLRETMAREGRVWTCVVSDCEEQLGWPRWFGVFCHPTVGGYTRHPSLSFSWARTHDGNPVRNLQPISLTEHDEELEA